MNFFDKYTRSQISNVTNKYEKYMGIERGYPKREKQTILDIDEFKSKTKKFYLELNEDEREILQEMLSDIIFWLVSEVINQKRNVDWDKSEDYRKFMRKLAIDKSFWNIE